MKKFFGLIVVMIAASLRTSGAFAACPEFTSGWTINAGSLPVAVATADFNGDSRQDMAIANESSNFISIRLGNGDGTFANATNVGTGLGPDSIAVGDFNRDGKTDMAVANYQSNSVTIHIGNGNGTFAAAVSYVVLGTNPYSVAVGDFNGDGKSDLATANYNSANVGILLGVGNGTFTPYGAFTAGTRPHSVAVGDFNRDGNRDLAVANTGSNSVSILLGLGNADFLGKVDFSVGVGPHTVAIADFNADGKSDFATANFDEGTVSILLGNGVGGFPTSSDYSAGSNTFSISVGDFNGDGRVDLVATDASSSSVLVLAGNGNGTVAAPVIYATGSYPTSVGVTDFNGDSKSDLAVTNYLDGNVSILHGGGGVVNGAFAAYVDTQSDGEHVAVGDFNRDGKQDLAKVSGAYTSSAGSFPAAVSVFLGTGNGTFGPAVKFAVSASHRAEIETGDFNRDGKTDLVVTNGFDPVVSVLLGAGNGTFGSPITYPGGPSPGPVVVADFDDNGISDLAFVNYGTTSISVLLGTSTGFVGPGPFTVGSNPGSLAVGDFNRDGKSDLAVANFDSDNLTILINKANGTGAFFAPVNYAVGDYPTAVAVGDFNRDGVEDLVVANAMSNNVSVILGVGNGSFTPLTTVAVGNYPSALVVRDFNEDGNADIAAANYYRLDGPPIPAALSVLFGSGNGFFLAAVNDDSGNRPKSMAAGDFNRDGKTDLVMANLGGSHSIYLNRSISVCIGSITPVAGSTAGGQSVVIAGTNVTYQIGVLFGGVAGVVTNHTVDGITTDRVTVTAPAHAAGLVDVTVNTNGGSDTVIGGYTYVVPPGTPTSVAATAFATFGVDIFWNAVSGADGYEIDRSSLGFAFAQIGTSGTNSYTDTSAAANTGYLYRVRATISGVPSSSSAFDLATTVIHSNAVGAGAPIRAIDFAQLRSAVNAVHVLANQGPVSFTDPTLDSSVHVKAVHMQDLRDNLDSALAALGLPTFPWVDTINNAQTIRAIHVQQVRSRTQ